MTKNSGNGDASAQAYTDPQTGKKIVYADNVPALLRGDLTLTPEEGSRIATLQRLLDDHPFRLAERGAEDWNLWVKARHKQWLVRESRGDTLHVALRPTEGGPGQDDFFDKNGIDFTKGRPANKDGLFEMPVSNFAGFVFPFPVSFQNASFGGDAGFGGARFGGVAGFSEARFGGVAGFSGARFGGVAEFEKASFGGTAKFDKASFGGDVWFDGASFVGNAGFHEASFDGVAGFEKASFGRNVRFHKANFGRDAVFGEARFSGDARFIGASFGGSALFEKARFGGNAGFVGASFGGDAWFSGAWFGGDAGFNRASFGGEALFREAEFAGGSAFIDSRFRQFSDFSRSRFLEAPRFDHSSFVEATNFENANFLDGGVFYGTVFKSSARFKNSSFGVSKTLHPKIQTPGAKKADKTSQKAGGWSVEFDRAYKEKMGETGQFVMPDFGDTIFAKPPDLETINYSLPDWPDLSVSGWFSRFFHWKNRDLYVEDPETARRIRSLQVVADEGHHHWRVHELFRKELYARCGHVSEASTLREIAMINAFELFSKCGLSFWRPMRWLGLFWLPFFMLLYGMVAGLTGSELMSGGFWELFSYSAANSLPFLGLFKGVESEAVTYLFHDADGIPYWLSVLHNLIATIHIFFALLAIRNYFKLG